MKPTFLTAMLLSLFALAACETVEGAGQDISTAGQTIAEESREVQAGM